MTTECYLCIGCNVEPRSRRIDDAVAAIGYVVRVTDQAPDISTPDITGIGAPYLNRVIRCLTTLSLDELRKRLNDLEAAAGRVPASKSTGIMPIDIDIIIYGDRTVSAEDRHRSYFLDGYDIIRRRY